MKELLEKLKSLDPTTYERYIGSDLVSSDQPEYISAWILTESAKMAWLQACVQDAILAKGWHFQQMAREGRCMVDITIFRPKCDIIDGPERKTPAEAMLAAYIEAMS